MSDDLRTLFPRICVNCDYVLEGLPLNAACPECGVVTPEDLISVSGYDIDSLKYHSHWSWISVVLVMFLYATIVFRHGLRSLYDDAFFLVLAASSIWRLLWLRSRVFFNQIQGPPFRLRLCSGGFEMRLGPGPLNQREWESRMRVESKRYRKMRKLLVKWNDPFLHFRVSGFAIQFYFDGDAGHTEPLVRQIEEWIVQSAAQSAALISEAQR